MDKKKTLDITQDQATEDLFEALAKTIPPSLSEEEMTVERFCARFHKSRSMASRCLGEGVKSGKLLKVERISENGKRVFAYIKS
jgi:predicted transcriptional regulator